MYIIIHGTKDGYRVLYSSPNCPIVVSDSRYATSGEAMVGQEAYSIAHNANGLVFTKFVIVRDNMRNMATGNIAFSVYLARNEQMRGEDIKSLLNKLSYYYCQRYAPYNNLENIREDWDFVAKIKNEFTIKELAYKASESIKPVAADSAFLYYASKQELERYFDEPLQEAYNVYKQIFFVKSDLQEQAKDPLNALRHNPTANLTGRFDKEDIGERIDKALELADDYEKEITDDFVDNKDKVTQTNEGYEGDNITEETKPLEAQVQKKTFWSRKLNIIAGVLFAVLVIRVGIWALEPGKFKSDRKITLTADAQRQSDERKIDKYIQGDIFILDTLIFYKDSWEQYKPKLNSNATKYEKWESFNELIEKAIRKRELINKLDFTELKKLTYPDQQQKFKNAIEMIDRDQYAEVKDGLGDIETLALTNIADSIDIVLSKLEAQANPGDQPEGLISKDIIAYLKGDQLQKSKLEEYKKQVEKSQLKEYKTKKEKQKLQASIDLALNFWSLNGKNNSYYSYNQNLAKDDYLKVSKLKAFVDEMCKFKKSACVTQLSKTDQRKTLSELAIIIKKKTKE